MAKQPESKLSTKIMKRWASMGCWNYKVHGSEFQPSGIPDISGVYESYSVWCESKMPGNKPSMIQWKRIRDIRTAGGLVVIAYSVEEAVDLIDHIRLGKHKRVDCGCTYTEKIDLFKKKSEGNYK